MHVVSSLATIGQGLCLLLLGLLAGSMFGIRFGYDITQYSPGTFVEVHQGAVRGLNDLLPLLGLVCLVLIIGLGVLARQQPGALWLYIAAAIGIAIAGLVTRLLNQPINAEVMSWSADALPANWQALRADWWTWHAIRLVSTLGAFLLLIAAIFVDRRAG